jgi:hypothetical protein
VPSHWDLEIDTYWIRRAAGSMEQAFRAFSAGGATQPPLPAAALGSSDTAAAVVALVNVRNRQAHAAAAQLQALANAVACQLHDAADRFDLAESNISAPTR